MNCENTINRLDESNGLLQDHSEECPMRMIEPRPIPTRSLGQSRWNRILLPLAGIAFTACALVAQPPQTPPKATVPTRSQSMAELKSRHLFTITMKLPPTLELGGTPAGNRRVFTVPADNLSATGFKEKSCRNKFGPVVSTHGRIFSPRCALDLANRGRGADSYDLPGGAPCLPRGHYADRSR